MSHEMQESGIMRIIRSSNPAKISQASDGQSLTQIMTPWVAQQDFFAFQIFDEVTI
jgi:hypothetical protein